MKILLIRHAESSKNVNHSFSSLTDEEPLTRIGEQTARQIAYNVSQYVRKNKMRCTRLHVANTCRAIMTGQPLATELNLKMYLHDEFKSIKNSNLLTGLTEHEVKLIDPVFTNELMLSRAGIFNAYHHSSNLTGDIIRAHEKTAYAKFTDLLSKSHMSNDVAVFIVHHSTLTDIVINLSRKYYDYPSNFYGNVECNLGHVFLFDNHRCVFDLANADSKELLSL